MERRSGKFLTGPAAPTRRTLLIWLQKHPTFEIVQSGQGQESVISKHRFYTYSSESFYVQVKMFCYLFCLYLPITEKDKEIKGSRDRLTQQERERKEAAVRERLAREEERREKEERERTKVKELVRRKKEEIKANMGPDPIRISVRKSLKDMLLARSVMIHSSMNNHLDSSCDIHADL